MKQRTVFASALLHAPRVLVVDEPMVGLDPHSIRLVKDLLQREVTQRDVRADVDAHVDRGRGDFQSRRHHEPRPAGVRRHDQRVARAIWPENQSLEAMYLAMTGRTGDENGSPNDATSGWDERQRAQILIPGQPN